MGKYLVNVTSTDQGLQGVAAKGGSAREKAARDAAQSAGGLARLLLLRLRRKRRGRRSRTSPTTCRRRRWPWPWARVAARHGADDGAHAADDIDKAAKKTRRLRATRELTHVIPSAQGVAGQGRRDRHVTRAGRWRRRRPPR